MTHYADNRRWSPLHNAWVLKENWTQADEIAAQAARIAELEADVARLKVEVGECMLVIEQQDRHAASLSRTGAAKVKALDEDDYEEIVSAAAINMRKATSGIRGQVITVQDSLDWWVMKETERRILSALEPAAPAISCYECGHELNGPYCPKCRPAAPSACPTCAGTGFRDKGGARVTIQRVPCPDCGPAAPEGRQDNEPRAYIVHAPEDEYYGTGPDRLQFHPLAQHDMDNGYRQTPLYGRPAEQAVAWQHMPGCGEDRESKMVSVSEGAFCDPCIAPLVAALNTAGIETVASCCGHGHRPGVIVLRDGRELFIAKDFEEARKVDAAFPTDINGDARPAEQAVTEEMVEALRNIDAEAPTKEPRDDWTSTDLDEAFYEGKLRGFWEMAVYAREALTAALGAQTPPEGAVTGAMVEAVVQAVRPYTMRTLFIDEHRELVRAALKAAMEADR